MLSSENITIRLSWYNFFLFEKVILIWIACYKPQIYEINISKSRNIDRHFELKILTKIINILCFRILSRIILGRFLRLENMFLDRFNLPETTKNIDKHQNFDIPKKIPNLGQYMRRLGSSVPEAVRLFIFYLK